MLRGGPPRLCLVHEHFSAICWVFAELFCCAQDPSRQVENVAVDFEVGAEVSEALLAMEADEHYDWDPSGVA